tara:strand:- start:205 stop:528 length:324 start_codon:yes stop_codon:yes gene_type:complete
MESVERLEGIIREALRDREYKALVQLEYDSAINITDLLDELRAVCSVTIINAETLQKVNDLKNRVLLKVKFLLIGAELKEHLESLIADALNLDSVYSFRIKKVLKVD